MRNADDRKKITPECLYASPPSQTTHFLRFLKDFFRVSGKEKENPPQRIEGSFSPPTRGAKTATTTTKKKEEKQEEKAGKTNC